MRFFIVLLVVVSSSPYCLAGEPKKVDCEKLDAIGSRTGVVIEGYDSGRRVTGKGRAYFFSGPDKACKEKELFIVPGDEVTAYREYRGYTAVLFINLKKKNSDLDTEGWMLSKRLEKTGTGIAPRQDTGE